MIVVAGHLKIRAGRSEEFLKSSWEAMIEARRTPGCHDFVVAPDPVETDRVNVYELWDNRSVLEGFRGSGPDSALVELIEEASVREFEVDPGA